MSAGGLAGHRQVPVLGVDTACYRAGRGPTVVLLHGGAPGACVAVNWQATFSTLVARGFDVVAYDQPGFGLSGAPRDHSIEFRYAHLLALLRALDVTRASLVGNSIGGLLSVLACHRQANHPVAIERIALFAPFPHFTPSAVAQDRYDVHRKRLQSVEPTLESVRALTSNTLYDIDRAPPGLVSLRHRMIAEPGNWASLLARRKAGNAFDADGVDTARIRVPTLVVWGMQDRSIPVEVGLEMVGRFPQGEFVFLHECSHWPQVDRPDAVHRLLAPFLRRAGRRRSET